MQAYLIQLTGAYAVSRTATFGLTKVLATELASDNIRVNCIAAGVTKVKLSEPVSWSKHSVHGRIQNVIVVLDA